MPDDARIQPVAFYRSMEEGTKEEYERVAKYWGLDQPLTTQYWRFLGNIVTLDFGTSYRYHESVFSLIAQRLRQRIPRPVEDRHAVLLRAFSEVVGRR